MNLATLPEEILQEDNDKKEKLSEDILQEEGKDDIDKVHTFFFRFRLNCAQELLCKQLQSMDAR